MDIQTASAIGAAIAGFAVVIVKQFLDSKHQATKLGEIHQMVNSNLTNAVNEIRALRAELYTQTGSNMSSLGVRDTLEANLPKGQRGTGPPPEPNGPQSPVLPPAA